MCGLFHESALNDPGHHAELLLSKLRVFVAPEIIDGRYQYVERIVAPIASLVTDSEGYRSLGAPGQPTQRYRYCYGGIYDLEGVLSFGEDGI
jgi:hypothetical protein